ncbi:hypothetical protein VNO78_11460 [Psophocarpus tetragonolobus]|uniref:Bidirectional sugar transporter SWEET n=1 Tax=Psophocarpus tetragonolobus TaxID=3891 RepID=A0AAN9SLT8_PSOTE
MAFFNNRNHAALAFGLLGNVISFLVYLAPLPTFYRIYKRKSTEGFQSLPYLTALFSSMLWLYYASLKPSDATLLITINSFGCVIESVYIIIYIIYATHGARKLTVKLLVVMNVGSFVLIFLVTHFALSGTLRVQVVGWICVTLSVAVFAAPLAIVARVIRTKNVEFMPFYLSLFLTLSAIMWLGYGVFLKDICVAIPNVLGFTLGILQMLLYGMYRNSGNTEKEEHELEPVKNAVVVNVNSSATGGVHPVPVIGVENNKEGIIIKGEEMKSVEVKEYPV